VVGCWHSYVSGPADATATHYFCSSKSRLVLPSWFYLCGASSPGYSRTKSKRAIKWLYVCVCMCMEEVTKYLDSGSGYPVDIIYLDFLKAFDKVPHCRLFLKLQTHGIRGNVLKWIENWLTERKQRFVLVYIFKDILSGVPHGSVLGPILFVIYINDVDDSFIHKILKFTDDTKIYWAVDSVEGIESLGADLHNLVLWSSEWQMLYNIDKCKVLHSGYNNPETNYVMKTTHLQDSVSEERDLGTIISADLKWEIGALLQ